MAELPSDAVMRRWLRGAVPGCLFAPRLAKAGSDLILYRTLPGPVDDQTASFVDALMLEATQAEKAVVITFPLLRSSHDVGLLIRSLAGTDRWHAVEDLQYEGPRMGLRVAMTWRTPADLRSRVMGLAPLGTMPMMRRAPYVALCGWMAGHKNPWRQPTPEKPRKVVMFSDMPHGMEQEEHDRLYAESEQQTRDLAVQTDEPPPGYKLTFCLESSARELIFP